jgi:hypothetical protein
MKQTFLSIFQKSKISNIYIYIYIYIYIFTRDSACARDTRSPQGEGVEDVASLPVGAATKKKLSVKITCLRVGAAKILKSQCPSIFNIQRPKGL